MKEIFWEANSRSPSQEPKLYHRVHKNESLPVIGLILSQMHPLHTFPP
jgi:hypothetical protein